VNVAHEELGIAIGRLGIADPDFRKAVTQGYTRALAEHAAGRRPDLPTEVHAFLSAAAGVAELHAAAAQETTRPRRRRRKA